MSEKNILLKIDSVSKSFLIQNEERKVLDPINLEINEGESLGILGHSGCGKTTLLRIIAMLEKMDEGQIILNGKKRECASKDVIMLFQSFNQLLPWKTVLKNITHPLKATGVVKTKKEAKEIALEKLEAVGLSEYANSYPGQLSGGMKQRVSFVRALVLQPRVLLLDEPFASLDYVTKKRLQKMTREECKKSGVTLIFVTHDIEEAINMADRIVVMQPNPGRIDTILMNPYSNTGTEEAKAAAMKDIYLKMNGEEKNED